MRILNFGSLNIDHVYTVDHFVRPGETIDSRSYKKFAGGKGFNQSMGLAHAGAEASHAGKIGADGLWLKERLQDAGVDTAFVDVTDIPTGHAIIQVNTEGENAIVIDGGANRTVSAADVHRVLSNFSTGDYLLLQNEISGIPDIITSASETGLRIVFNPAPITPDVASYPLELVDIFILNQVEAGELTGESDPEAICASMRKTYPKAATVLTLGNKGARYVDAETNVSVDADTVSPVDTTAAGDTFIGFFLTEFKDTRDPAAALTIGCKAAGICVTRPGAADSIPTRAELKL